MKCKRQSDGRKLDHHTLQMMRMQAIKAHKRWAVGIGYCQEYGILTSSGLSLAARLPQRWPGRACGETHPGSPSPAQTLDGTDRLGCPYRARGYATATQIPVRGVDAPAYS